MSTDTKALIAAVCEDTSKLAEMRSSVDKLRREVGRAAHTIPTLMAMVINLQSEMIEMHKAENKRLQGEGYRV